MSQTGIWLAMCPRTRSLPMEALAEFCEQLSHVRVTPSPDEVVVHVDDPLTGNAADVSIGFTTQPHVHIESLELADRARSAGERITLLRSDSRYEIVWDLQFSDETYNTMLRIAEWLQAECGAVVVDMTDGRFVLGLAE